MLQKIGQRFEPPIIPGDEERTEQARILSAIEFYLFGILALSAVAIPFLTPSTERNTVMGIVLGLLLLNGISSALLFRGCIESSGILIAVSTWIVDVAVAALAGGISSPMMFSAVIIAVVFGLLLRRTVAIILISMSILAGLGMAILPGYGVVLPQLFHFSEIGVWFVLTVCLIFSGATLNYTLKRLDTALKQSRLKAEETAAKSEALFRAMFDNINDGMIFSDVDGVISYRSPTYQRIDGYSNADWGRLKYFEQIHPDDIGLMQRGWNAIMQSPAAPVRLEYRLRVKNGMWVWVESVLQNLLYDPDIRSIVLTTHNITDRKRAEDALRGSEAKFRAVIENSHDGILFLDANSNIIYRSSSYVQLNGYKAEERLGRNGFDMVHPDDLEKLTLLWGQVVQTPGVPVMAEYRTRHKNGSWIWVESTLNNLLSDPDVGAVVLNSRDITERKRSEQAQAEAYAKMEKLFEILPVGISVLGEERRLLKQNPALEKILNINSEGLERGEYRYQTYVRADGTPMPASEFASSRVYAGEPSVFNIETGIIHEDSETTWTVVSAIAVPFSDWRTVVVTSDITDRKRAELKLMESEERFRSLIEQSSEGIVLTDEYGTIIEWNRAQSEMTGMPPDHAIGERVWDVQYQMMLPERRLQFSPEMIRSGMQSVFSSGTSPFFNRQLEYEIELDGHQRKTLLQTSFPIKTEKGYRLGNITLDVTDARRIEQTLRQRDVDVLRSALEERQRLGRELHDSVGQVLGYVGFQTEAARTLYASGKSDEADAQLVRLSSIAQNAHADVREYILNLRVAPTVREPLFKTLQNYMDGYTHNYNIQTSLLIGKGLDENIFDAKAQLNIFRVVQEALSNIRKHAHASRAAVSFEMESEMVRMTIQDDGRGFDPQSSRGEDLSHFGLSFMNERVNELGGAVHFESTLHSGTRVLVEIPLHKEKPS
jgi:PAS domain S-box-containing protein